MTNSFSLSATNNVNINGNETTRICITTKEISDYQMAGDATVQLENK